MPSLAERVASAAADLRRLSEDWRPSEADLADAVGLENWMLAIDGEFPVLIGDAVGHPLLGDQFITTSRVLWISEDRTIARTLSRWYRLGTSALSAPDVRDPQDDPNSASCA